MLAPAGSPQQPPRVASASVPLCRRGPHHIGTTVADANLPSSGSERRQMPHSASCRAGEMHRRTRETRRRAVAMAGLKKKLGPVVLSFGDRMKLGHWAWHEERREHMAERRGLGSLAGSVERRQISPAGWAPQTYPTRSCATRDSLVPRRSDAVCHWQHPLLSIDDSSMLNAHSYK